MIALMHDGLELGKFVDNNGKLELKLNNGIKQSWLPYIFDIGIDAGKDMNIIINAWIKERVFPSNRYGNKRMLKELGLKKYDAHKIAEITRCSLLTDPYWLVYNESDTYNKNSIRGQIGLEYYPYNSTRKIDKSEESKYIWRVDTELSNKTEAKKSDNIIEWKDKKLVLHDFVKSHANGGRLEKFWVEDIQTGRQFLIKGSGIMSYEPYCEKMAYIIGRDLGIDVLEYDIIPASKFKDMINLNPFCKYVSICEKIDKAGCYITSVAEIKRAKNVVRDEHEKPITNREVMNELLDQDYIERMFLFDAIIGNNDRHYGNIHLTRNLDGEFCGAPILDNGASLLAQASILGETIYNYDIGKHYNHTKTGSSRKFTHDEQLDSIQKLRNVNFNIASKTIEIIHDIQPILNEMPKSRSRSIKKYLVYRLHRYLGVLKNDNKCRLIKLKQVKSQSVNKHGDNKEIEHT